MKMLKKSAILAIYLLLATIPINSSASGFHESVAGQWCRENPQTGFLECQHHVFWRLTFYIP
ncbi:MAG: hypothetical protein KKC01_12245 [Gammaproteobacteria bacterium]|nr:hypothetical protein [Gammaproteobacteria bacterium]